MPETTLRRTVTVKNPTGLHLRPLDELVRQANQFASDIVIIKESRQVDGKSMLEVMGLMAERGSQLELQVTGPDAADAIEALAKLVEKDFAAEFAEQSHENNGSS